MATGAPIVAALTRAERRVVNRLRRARATSQARAVALPELRVLEERRLERLKEAGVICDAGEGRYWVDEAKYETYRDDRRTVVWVALAFVAGLLLAILLMFDR